MIANESLRYEMTSAPKIVYEINSYLNTGQLDLWGGGDLGGSQSNEFSSESIEILEEGSLIFLSKLESLDLLVLHIKRVFKI